MKRFMPLVAALLVAGASPAWAGAVSSQSSGLSDFSLKPSYDWSGAYAGVSGGWTGVDVDAPYIGTMSGAGGLAGVYAGYNWQRNPFVFGVEGGLSYNSFKRAESCPNPSFTCTAQVKWQGGVRARAGYAIGSTLLYVTGGLAVAQADGSTDNGTLYPDSHILYGYTVGAGADIALSHSLVSRIEYRYTDFAKQDYMFDMATPGVHLHSNQFTAGLAYKF